MESRIQRALENHKKGYNCAQSVACAYCDLVGVDEAVMFRAAEGFGAGMGGKETTCGAVSGAVLLAGLKNSDGAIQEPKSKGSTYKLSGQIVEEFTRKNKSVICKEIKREKTGEPLRSCDGCIEDAAFLAEQILFAE